MEVFESLSAGVYACRAIRSSNAVDTRITNPIKSRMVVTDGDINFRECTRALIDFQVPEPGKNLPLYYFSELPRHAPILFIAHFLYPNSMPRQLQSNNPFESNFIRRINFRELHRIRRYRIVSLLYLS